MASANQKADELIVDINVTPLVDVCLVLVIIFMAVAPMAMTWGISVLHSKAKTEEGKASIEENVQVKLSSDGKLTVNGAEVAPGALQGKISEALARSKDRMVTVTADESNHVGDVVDVLDTAKQAGAAKVAILKSEAAPPPAPAPAQG
ncbi:MAG: biopolymer transporter ExbD [Elusimicrobia bacterium]|nr:biopolymer transporter ExbD [Elusimicrobiota bacterium]